MCFSPPLMPLQSRPMCYARQWPCTEQGCRVSANIFPGLQEIIIEPLDPRKHNRAVFCCGVDRPDNFLKRTARKHQTGDFTRVWVATDDGQAEILGYYALNAHSLDGDGLPANLTRNAPRHGGIPAVYISMIAVDNRHQGQGFGNILLADGLNRAAAVARLVGLKAVILDVIEDGGPEITEKRRAFYEAMGFQSLPSRPLRMFISIKTIRAAKGIGET